MVALRKSKRHSAVPPPLLQRLRPGHRRPGRQDRRRPRPGRRPREPGTPGAERLHGWEANASRDRLKRPLARREGRLRQASWDETMGLIVDRPTGRGVVPDATTVRLAAHAARSCGTAGAHRPVVSPPVHGRGELPSSLRPAEVGPRHPTSEDVKRRPGPPRRVRGRQLAEVAAHVEGYALGPVVTSSRCQVRRPIPRMYLPDANADKGLLKNNLNNFVVSRHASCTPIIV